MINKYEFEKFLRQNSEIKLKSVILFLSVEIIKA